MAAYKILTILMVLILVQSSLAKPVDDSSSLFDSSEEDMRNNPTPAQKIQHFTLNNLISIGQKWSDNTVNVCRNILKDESVMANDKPQVLEFKKNLTMFVEKYEANKKPLQLWDIMHIYTNTIYKYDRKRNPESEFIIKIINKYHNERRVLDIIVEFEFFMQDFDKLFKKNKAHLDKPMLEWYENYSSLTDFQEKINAYKDLIDLA